MRKRCCVGWILLAGLLTGCCPHLSNQLTAGRQMPILTDRCGISIPLNNTSEVQLDFRGFRMGFSPHAEPRNSIDSEPDPTPWLRYRLHF